MSIGQRLRETRIRRKMTVGALADASKLSKGFISQVENGLSSPSLSSLLRIADSLDMPLSQLLGEPTPPIAHTSQQLTGPHVVRAPEIGASRPSLEVMLDSPSGRVVAVRLSWGVELREPARSAQADGDE